MHQAICPTRAYRKARLSKQAMLLGDERSRVGILLSRKNAKRVQGEKDNDAMAVEADGSNR